ncbi:hypothetical protein OF83DRAFT_1170941 [Amylostereum chailletii]|nr:hypothetical protein OF83DRAFT_1170941 [Amylostereum chailletii]
MSQFTDSNLQVPSNTGPGNHILSNSSRVAGFDIFIFWPSDPGVVMAGINSTLNPDINVGQIKTWIKLLEPESQISNQ